MTRLLVNLDEEGVRPVSSVLRTTDSFEVKIVNDGSPKHVHLSVKGDAERYVSAEANNVYVEDDETVEVVVGPTPGKVDGELEVTSDYGSDTATVELTVGDESDEETEGSVDIDESLSQPMKPDAGDDEIPRVDVAVVLVLGLAALLSLVFSFVFEGFQVVGVVVAAFAVLGAGFVWFLSRYSDGLRPKD
ncbi:MAG: hypothetical protein ACI9QA_000146 [Methanobacteriota archaeon]|uniref:Uncharacterized protein n=1 Tax=Halorutilus salinus TaxID=2487751 RepID=A0A9Q4C468_9EURY|nr:hypothetical protein [Halorutilus salinus]MCX2818786.1 hypothetical protein [Halorutilus salinus]